MLFQKALITILLSVACQGGVTGPLCYSCNREIKPYTCSRITRCGRHEQCYLERQVSQFGEYVYMSGCRDRDACSVKRSHRDLRVDCSECCHGDLCNAAGCGQALYQASQNEGPLCFNCTRATSPEGCYQVERCAKGQTCSRTTMHQNGITYYNAGCRQATECLLLDKKGHCNGCCLTDYCNWNCSSVATNVQTTRGQPAWVTVPKQLSPRTTQTPGLQCMQCHNTYENAFEPCRNTLCGPQEVCYAVAQFGSIGFNSYHLGCIDASYCTDSEQDSSVVFGRRNSAPSRILCCSTTNCNVEELVKLAQATAQPVDPVGK